MHDPADICFTIGDECIVFFAIYLKSMKLPSHHDYLKYLKCVNPVQLRDRLISTLSMDELNCRKENVLNVPVIILGVVMLKKRVIYPTT
jgi:hypothetical protein